MTKAEFKKILEEKIIGVDATTFKKDGTIVLMRGFFYTNGMTDAKFADKVMKQFQEIGIADQITLIETYEQWRDFKGGASIKASSHFGMIIKLK